jgi:hypothetical protein
LASETITPNIGLQIPAFNQANWQVPTNYNWNLLDQIFGGEIQVPALDVGVITISNIAAIIAPSFVAETPSGVIPGNAYTLTYVPVVMLGFYVNGIFQRPGLDYTLGGANGNLVTLTNPTTQVTDTVFAIYLQGTT